MEDIVDSEKVRAEIEGQSIIEEYSKIVDAPLFHVSLSKFCIMFVMTFGLYQLYWAFKQWQALRNFYQLDAWPVARSFFSIFFTHSLFVYITEYIKETEREYSWHQTGYATLYVFLVVVGSLFSNLIDEDSTNILLWSLTFVIPMMVVLPLYKAQKAINFALETVSYSSNDKLTLFNWLWIILGTAYWGLIVFSLVIIALG
ncbi:hypothetical protein [Shewanella woodyi]|uniref:DUF4234 domain-containing protein n=1 Tax=Shewanella woodyi (strain ATCC 51908 / MS32) TaxID=392500 RepID=B1KIN8_SHEWM|nr:hypothetical protein [Shewanella woodyi]ACA88534.1 conserved hypothetical protein [Shewanella woodyi ATCC 51908]